MAFWLIYVHISDQSKKTNTYQKRKKAKAQGKFRKFVFTYICTRRTTYSCTCVWCSNDPFENFSSSEWTVLQKVSFFPAQWYRKSTYRFCRSMYTCTHFSYQTFIVLKYSHIALIQTSKHSYNTNTPGAARRFPLSCVASSLAEEGKKINQGTKIWFWQFPQSITFLV